MVIHSHQGANALSHPFYLSRIDLEGIKALASAGSTLATKMLAQARKDDPIAVPPDYVNWTNAFDMANAFLREVDFCLKLAEQKPPSLAMSYHFTQQEVLSLNTWRETAEALLTLVNDVTKHLFSEASHNEKVSLMRVQICSLRTNQQYHSPNLRAFEEALAKAAKRMLEAGHF